jgi:hypothetical protein
MKCTVFWFATPCNSEKTNVSEEHIASIFTVEERAKEEMVKKQTARSLWKN